MDLKIFEYLIKLLHLKRNFSGFYKESNEREWLKELEKEVKELEAEFEKGNVEKIKDELGDVMMDFVCVVDKVRSRYNISLEEVVKNLEKKLKHRAPHFFEGKYLPKEEEIKQWVERKKERI